MTRLRDRLPTPPAPLRAVGRWIVRLLPLLGIAGLCASVRDLHSFAVLPAALGIACWTVGNYGMSVLRWRSVSGRGFGFGWYARVFSEGEVLGLLTPQHAGALYWRAKRLRAAGADCAGAAAELTADRLCTSTTITLALVVGGSALPASARYTVWGVVALGVAALVATRRRWLHRLPTLSAGRLALWFGYSVAFQLCYIAFVLCLIAAVGVSVSFMGMVALLAVAQVASVLPGVHGAGPKEGVLAGGLVTMGVTHTTALAFVGLLSAVVWIPALAIGGTGLLGRGVVALRARRRASAAHPALAHAAGPHLLPHLAPALTGLVAHAHLPHLPAGTVPLQLGATAAPVTAAA